MKRLLLTILTIFLVASPAAVGAQPINIPVNQLPKYSETPFGNVQAPVSFIYVGEEQQIRGFYLSRGWYEADRISATSLLRAYRAAINNLPYPTAPFSPSFINGESQELAFQLPTPANTIRQRHHTRIWDTNVRASDGRRIWVGTASFDRDIAYVGRSQIPTHTIDPNIDAERDFILRTLGIPNAQYIQLVRPQSGQNFSGDQFYTDGRAAVIVFNRVGSPPAYRNYPNSAYRQRQVVQPPRYRPTPYPHSYNITGNPLGALNYWIESTATSQGLPY
jgi:hypothetical protein